MPHLLELLNNEMKDFMLKRECSKMMINEELSLGVNFRDCVFSFTAE
jgi:hypothetical protein